MPATIALVGYSWVARSAAGADFRGDVGVGIFLISPDDLARSDFSRVMFTWDDH